MTLPTRPSVVDLRADRRRFLAGVQKVAALVTPTYGPLPRVVGVAPLSNIRRPELLDDGGLLARRLVQLDHPVEDIGAMFLRGLLWKQRERCGDGTALVAILFEALVSDGVRLLAAGLEPNALRQELEDAAAKIDAALIGTSRPVVSEAEAVAIAASICGDDAIARAVGETLWGLGSDATIEVRSHYGREVAVDAIAGSYWPSAPLTRAPLDASSDRRATLFRPAIVLSDLEINDPTAIIRTLRFAHAAGAQGLLLVARSLSPETIAIINANSSPAFPVIAVRTPGTAASDQLAMLEELTALSTGRPLIAAAGETLASIRAEYVGMTRRAWIETGHFGLIGPTGDPAPRIALLGELRARQAATPELNASDREKDDAERIQERIARLTGAAARIEVGMSDGQTTDVRKALAERTVRGLRSALRNGVIEGGGSALRSCRPAVAEMRSDSDRPERRAAAEMLRTMLAVPADRIASNVGLDPALIDGTGGSGAIDLRTGRKVRSGSAIVLDPVMTIRSAVQLAAHGAGQALSIDTLVLRRSPEQATMPDGRPPR